MFDRFRTRSRPRFEPYGGWLLVVLIGVAGQSAAEALADDLLANIRRSWEATVSRDALVRWQVMDEPDWTCFSAWRTEFADLNNGPETESIGEESSSVLIQDRAIRFESRRYARLRHRPDWIQNSFDRESPLQFSPALERGAATQTGPDFTDAIAADFANSALEVGTLVPFTRSVTSAVWLDQWGEDSEGNSRATVRSFLKAGSVRWARLTVDTNLSEQIDSLHCQAALLAMRRVHCPTIDLQWQSCRLLPESQIVDGRPCVVMVEAVEAEANERHYWIERTDPFLIRRFRGRVPLEPLQRQLCTLRDVPPRFGDTMIEIEYDRVETAQWKPKGWSVLSREGPEWPLRGFSRATVQEVAFDPSGPDSIVGQRQEQPLGHGWVINEITNDQYIALGDGTIRKIAEEELRFFPTFHELARTPPGGLADSLMVSREQTYGRWVLGSTGLALLLLGIRRRRLRTRGTPSCAS